MIRCPPLRYRDKVAAMFARGGQAAWKRQEARLYRCERCGGWHITSKPKRGTP